MSYRERSVHDLELSVLSKQTIDQLELETIGDLADTTTVDFLVAAYERATPGQRVAPALREVKELLAQMGLDMANYDVDAPRDVPHDGPELPGFDYLGTFKTSGRLAFGEQRFLFGDFDEAAQTAATIDNAAESDKSEVKPIDLAEVEVEPGLWDVYAEDGPYRTHKLIAQRRGVIDEPAFHLRHIGGLNLADPIVFIVNANSRHDHFTRRALIGSARATFDRGATAVLAYDDNYEWVTFTSQEGGKGPIRKVEIQAGVGE